MLKRELFRNEEAARAPLSPFQKELIDGFKAQRRTEQDKRKAVVAKRDDDAVAFMERCAARAKAMAARAQEDAKWADEDEKWLRQRMASAATLTRLDEEIAGMSKTIESLEKNFAPQAERKEGGDLQTEVSEVMTETVT